MTVKSSTSLLLEGELLLGGTLGRVQRACWYSMSLVVQLVAGGVRSGAAVVDAGLENWYLMLLSISRGAIAALRGTHSPAGSGMPRVGREKK